MRLTPLAILACVLLATPCGHAAGDSSTESGDGLDKVQKLDASRIQARATRGLKALRPKLGLPLKNGSETPRTNAMNDLSFGERISVSEGVWTSMNLESELPNWVAWDLEPGAVGTRRDPLMDQIPAERRNCNMEIWNAVLDECSKWYWDKPSGGVGIACGPLVNVAEAGKGKDAVPYGWFVVICKKDRSELGWKSVGFLIPGAGSETKGIYACSASVNMIEYKSGYDFFRLLPDGLQEVVEGMTTYELFCSFVEDEAYRDDPSEHMEDFNEMMSDWLEDFRDR